MTGLQGALCALCADGVTWVRSVGSYQSICRCAGPSWFCLCWSDWPPSCSPSWDLNVPRSAEPRSPANSRWRWREDCSSSCLVGGLATRRLELLSCCCVLIGCSSSGILTLIAVSWYAGRIIHDFYNHYAAVRCVCVRKRFIPNC